MSMQDPISDMLTRVRNAQTVGKTEVSMPSSKLKIAVARVLLDEGYIRDIQVDGDAKPTLTITLKYFNGKPVIETIKRVSRPGLRVYKNHKELPRVLGGFGIAIVSTSQGVMSSKVARERKVGGEVLCVLW